MVLNVKKICEAMHLREMGHARCDCPNLRMRLLIIFRASWLERVTSMELAVDSLLVSFTVYPNPPSLCLGGNKSDSFIGYTDPTYNLKFDFNF